MDPEASLNKITEATNAIALAVCHFLLETASLTNYKFCDYEIRLRRHHEVHKVFASHKSACLFINFRARTSLATGAQYYQCTALGERQDDFTSTRTEDLRHKLVRWPFIR